MKNRVVTARELLEQVKELVRLVERWEDKDDIESQAKLIADHKDILNPYLAQEYDG